MNEATRFGIVFFCNSYVAFPAMEWLLAQDVVSGLVVSLQAGELGSHIIAAANQRKIPSFLMEAGGHEGLAGWLEDMKPDAAFVMTFPSRIRPEALRIPRLGFFNFHPGLLPAYRGPDPLFWQIRNREPEGGITVHRMNPRFDEGPVVHVEKVAIRPEDTYDSHLQELNPLFVNTARWMLERLRLPADAPVAIPQKEEDARYYKKPTVADRTIDWSRESAASIAALTRACHTAYDGAITWLGETLLHIGPCAVVEGESCEEEAGVVHLADPVEGITVCCADGKLLRVATLGVPGALMRAQEFVSTLDLKAGDRFLSAG